MSSPVCTLSDLATPAIAPRSRRFGSIDRGCARECAHRLWELTRRSESDGHLCDVTPEERFHALFEEHYRAVARFLRTRGHDAADTDDLVAGAFEVAWRQIDRVPEGREGLPWLLGVARNLSRNARRKSQREGSFVEAFAATAVPWSEMPLEARESGAEVMAALAQLKPVDRDLILLVAWDELTPAEAGRVLGLRPVAARSRLHRARQRLNGLLEEASAPPPAPTARNGSTREDSRAR